VFALADIKAFATSGDYDVVVVDCAPTAETIRLLSLPDVLGWYMEKIFDTQRRLTRLARPVVQRMTGVPIAGDGVFSAMRRFYDRLDGVRDILTDGAVTSARIVVNPERIVVAEARRTFTYLSLFGYHVDSVVVNRVLPADLDVPWFAQWKASQAAQLEEITGAFAPLPLLVAELASDEVVGWDSLLTFAKGLYGETDATDRLSDSEPFRVEGSGDALCLSLRLPDTTGADVQLSRADDELILTLGPLRRAIVLPDSLARRSVAGARFVDGRLVIEFGAP